MKQQQRECAPKGASEGKKNVIQVMRKGKLETVFPPGSMHGLYWFMRRYLDLTIPDVRVCGCHASPMDYLWYAYSRDRLYQERKNSRRQGLENAATQELTNGDCIVWANRAGGKTQLAAVATLLEGLFKPGCQTRILAGSLAQSGRMYGYG